jgi:ATP-dependent RNA helicase DHX8/PRP22
MAPSNELEQLELLSLVNSITQELVNHTGLNDSTLADFLLHLHSESTGLADFKSNCAGAGADFPDSFLTNVDRLILSMHPKYKKKVKSSGNGNKKKGKGKDGITGEVQVLDENQKNQMRLFPGLAMPNVDWEPSYKEDPKGLPKGKGLDPGTDDLMAQLDGVGKKRSGGGGTENEADENEKKRRREPSPDYGRGRNDNDRGRPGPAPRRSVDDKPILYKVYPGKVAGMKDFGAFVTLEGVAGRAEGTYHTSASS